MIHDPAFPSYGTVNKTHEEGNLGMDLRDYFAAQIMGGILGSLPTHIATGFRYDGKDLAKRAYEIADEMVAARSVDRNSSDALNSLSPAEVAEKWYDHEDIWAAICDQSDADWSPPPNLHAETFAAWMATHLQRAMAKGIELERERIKSISED